MTARRVAIGERPKGSPAAEDWIHCGDSLGSAGADIAEMPIYTARLTVDLTPALRGRIKMAAFRQGVTVAQMLRALFDREFPQGAIDT